MKMLDAVHATDKVIAYVEKECAIHLDKDIGTYYAACYGTLKGILPGLLSEEFQEFTLKRMIGDGNEKD
jgi:hypothetical protein